MPVDADVQANHKFPSEICLAFCHLSATDGLHHFAKGSETGKG